MTDHLFDVSLAKLDEAQHEVRRQLVTAQLREYPDSLILSHKEMLKRWLNFDKVPYLMTFEEWRNEPLNALIWKSDGDKNIWQLHHEYDIYVRKARAEHAQQVLTSIAIAHQHPCVVFYECGKQEDGTYQWRGARYGVEGSQYASGFGHF